MSTANGPVFGFYDNGTTSGSAQPTTTDDIPNARNGGGAPGWKRGNDTLDTGGGKSAGFMASVTVGISRRGSTFYGMLNGARDHTFADVSGTAAGGFFIGCAGANSGWSLTSLRYRLGPGLPNIT
jgi:hypothetical protein